MESSKVPFITANPLTRPPQRELRQWRPLSTRPWILLLFLAATGTCFGLLVTISLVDKQTSLHTKRDATVQLGPRDIVRRQSSAATTTGTNNSTSNSLLSLSDSSPVESTSAASSEYLSLTSQTAQLSLTSQCFDTSTVTITTYTATVGEGTPVYQDASSTPAYTGTCSVVYETVIDTLILSLTDQSTTPSTTTLFETSAASNMLSLTSTSNGLSLTTQDEPQSSKSDESIYSVSEVLSSEMLSLTASQPIASSISTSAVSASSAALSLTSQARVAVSSTQSSSTSKEAASATSSAAAALSLTKESSKGTSTLDVKTSPEVTTVTTETNTNGQPVSTYVITSSSTPASTVENFLFLFTETDTNGQPIATYTSTISGSSVISFTSYLLSTASSASSYMITETDANGRPTATYMTTVTSGNVYSSATVMLESAYGTTYLIASDTTDPPSPSSMASSGSNLMSITSNSGQDTASITAAASATGQVSLTKSTSTSTSASSTSSSKSVDPEINEQLVLIKMTFHNYDYFLAVYLPKLIAVIMACLWSIIFAALKLTEPMYQLSMFSGASAKDAMFGNYLSSEITVSSISAMYSGQWVLILGCIVLVAWAVVVAFISESMIVISTGTCSTPELSDFRCDPGWAVNLPVLKFLIAVVGIIFLLTATITWIIIRRKTTGMFVDPSSIAAMTEMLGNPAVMHDLRDIEPIASESEVRRILGENRYKLGFYDTATGREVQPGIVESGEQRWGLIKISGPAVPKQIGVGEQTTYDAVSNPEYLLDQEARANRKRRRIQLAYDAIMLLTSLTIFGIVVAYYLESKSDPFNDFFNSQGFGPRLVLTGLALILSTGWRQISQEVTLLAPYRNMAKAFEKSSGVPAKRSILAATACTPFTAFHKGFLLRNYVIVAVAMSAVLSEVLLVAVSGVPFSTGQIKPSLQASTFISVGILFIMAVTSIIVIVHNRTSAGGTRRLPRSPDTLVGVWLYLCGSELAQHNGWDDHDSPVLDQKGLNAKYGKGQYAFARAIGVDGITRWTIDEAAELQCSKAVAAHSGYPESKQSNISVVETTREEHYDDDTELEGYVPQQQQRPYQLEIPSPPIRPQAYTPSLYSTDSYPPSIPRVRNRFELHNSPSDAQSRAPGRQPQRPPSSGSPYQGSRFREYFIEAPARSETPQSQSQPNRRFESLRSRHGPSVTDTHHPDDQLLSESQPYSGSDQWPLTPEYERNHARRMPFRSRNSDRSRRTGSGRAPNPYEHTQYSQVGR